MAFDAVAHVVECVFEYDSENHLRLRGNLSHLDKHSPPQVVDGRLELRLDEFFRWSSDRDIARLIAESHQKCHARVIAHGPDHSREENRGARFPGHHSSRLRRSCWVSSKLDLHSARPPLASDESGHPLPARRLDFRLSGEIEKRIRLQRLGDPVANLPQRIPNATAAELRTSTVAG